MWSSNIIVFLTKEIIPFLLCLNDGFRPCNVPTLKTQYRTFKTNIPRKGIAWPQSKFPHSCVSERFINSHDRSAFSTSGIYVDRSWEYIQRAQTYEFGNWDWGRAIPFQGTNKWDSCCSACAVCSRLFRFINTPKIPFFGEILKPLKRL